MRTNHLRSALIAIISIAFAANLYAQQSTTLKLSDVRPSVRDIADATCSLYVWQVLGWQYDKSGSPIWTKGVPEEAEVDRKALSKGNRNVRAVCLGEENGYFVLMTLRSFVDPTFPNPHIQGISSQPKDKSGHSTWGSSERPNDDLNRDLVRYGYISLASYEDVGGGDLVVRSSAIGITHADTNAPRFYGGWMSSMTRPKETIDGITYEVPNKDVSAKTHLQMAEAYRLQPVTIRIFGSHDIAFIYFPARLFGDRRPKTLGLQNPTASAALAFQHNPELFGFKFSLIGDETMRLIQDYNPPAGSSDVTGAGFGKVLTLAGLALSPQTLQTLKIIDTALNRYIPDVLPVAATRLAAGSSLWDAGKSVADKIANDPALIGKIRDTIWPVLVGVWKTYQVQ